MYTKKVDVVVIGAGIAGLSFARAIQQRGKNVLIVERSRAVGGRCATWRHEEQALDYGVPFLHGRSPLYWSTIDELLADELIPGWPRLVEGEGPTCQPRALDPEVRHAAVYGGLNTLAKRLADGLEILRESQVTQIRMQKGSAEISGENFSVSAGTLVLAAANNQSLRLLNESSLGRAAVTATALFGLAPTLPTMSLLVCYDAPAAQPVWELLLPELNSPIQLISNESSKNKSAGKLCLCIQARPAWSRKYIESSAEEWSRDLLREAQPFLGEWAIKPDWQRPHRWMEARLDSASRLRRPLLQIIDGCKLGFIGEYFDPAGGLEGAFLSGKRLANMLMEAE